MLAATKSKVKELMNFDLIGKVFSSFLEEFHMAYWALCF